MRRLLLASAALAIAGGGASVSDARFVVTVLGPGTFSVGATAIPAVVAPFTATSVP